MGQGKIACLAKHMSFAGQYLELNVTAYFWQTCRNYKQWKREDFMASCLHSYKSVTSEIDSVVRGTYFLSKEKILGFYYRHFFRGNAKQTASYLPGNIAILLKVKLCMERPECTRVYSSQCMNSSSMYLLY